MIHHIFKIIWVERRINAWILLELILIFCILWFCTDYLYFMAKQYMEPKGFDIENTYKIEIGIKEEGEDALNRTDSILYNQSIDNLWTIYDRVKRHPAVAEASFSVFATPYEAMTGNFYMVDSVEQQVFDKIVTPEYFNVFRINKLAGRFFDWSDITANVAVINADEDNLFAKKAPENIESINLWNTPYKVVGVVNRIKMSEYENYKTSVYLPLEKNNSFLPYSCDLCIRIKPEAARNFVEQFSKDMEAQFEIGPYFLSSVVPMENKREAYMEMRGYDNDFKSIFSISAFLLVNIFLIIVGTFWFRVQARRGEIGLRIAFGATKADIKTMFTGETILLLFVASLIAAVVCVNISITDVLKEIGVPTPHRGEASAGVAQYFINYVITFVLLAIVAIAAVWYPAKRASDIPPVDALRDE